MRDIFEFEKIVKKHKELRKFTDIVRRSDIELMRSSLKSNQVAYLIIRSDDKLGIMTLLNEVEGSLSCHQLGDTTIIILERINKASKN